jgi:hypothetical protein
MQGANSDTPITPCSNLKVDIFRPAMKAAINPNSKSTVFETNLKESPRDSASQQGGTVMLRHYAGERIPALQCKLVYRGYDLEVKRALSGWQVGIYPRSADLPILGRCEVFTGDQEEAVVVAKARVDGAYLL